jgi:hypothetical protein
MDWFLLLQQTLQWQNNVKTQIKFRVTLKVVNDLTGNLSTVDR